MGLGIKEHSFYKLGMGKKIKTLKPEEVFSGNDFAISLNVSFGSVGGLSPREGLFLISCAKYLAVKNIFEIGTCQGITTHNLASNIEGMVYTLDLPAEAESTELKVENAEKAFMGTKDADRFWVGKETEPKIKSLRGDSASFDYSPYLQKMDLVFVDGSHSYEYVQSDSKHALKILQNKGAILWHDYAPCWPGVVKALNELSSEVELVHIEGTSLVLHYKK